MENKECKGNCKKESDGIVIAFVYYSYTSFVKQDYEILSRNYDVEKVSYTKFCDILKLIRIINSADLSFSWFAAGHGFLAVILSRILRKRSIVVAGGHDVACIPEFSYGQYCRDRLRRMFTSYCLNNADSVIAVSEFTMNEVLARSSPKMLRLLYNGIDTGWFAPTFNKSDMVLTVASGSGSLLCLKGIDTFIRAAAYLPNIRFYVVGLSPEDLVRLDREGKPSNLELMGRMRPEELKEYYQRAKVYCQLSYRESFGVALAEAMSCGCVPVVTSSAALPEVVGDTGFYVPYGDPSATAEAIEKALACGRGDLARDRIVKMFSLEIRERELVGLIADLIGH